MAPSDDWQKITETSLWTLCIRHRRNSNAPNTRCLSEICCRNPDFPMFDSTVNHKDLIFQDATVRLVRINPMNQTYDAYLGPTFIRSMQRMASIDCVTGQAASLLHCCALLYVLTGLLLVNMLSFCIWWPHSCHRSFVFIHFYLIDKSDVITMCCLVVILLD